MASTYSDLKIELIGTGDQSGTWGTTTNNNLSTALGEAITGSADVSFSSADVTVTLTDTNAAQTARNLRLNLTGTSGGARNLILGSGCQIEKLYLINNGLADTVTVKNTSGTGIAVPAGKTMFVYNNGTNVVDAITHATSLTLGSALPVASGGTGTSTAFTTGSVVFAGASGTYTQDNANFFWDDATNSLGIGTTSPTAGFKLDVASSGRFSTGEVRIDLNATNAGGRLWNLYSGGGGNVGAGTFAITEGGATQRLVILGGGSSESMRIDSSGNVGIGTTSPTAKLDVNGDAVVTGVSGYRSISLNGVITGGTTARYAGIQKNYDSPFEFKVYAGWGASGNGSATIFYRDSVNESMRIDSSGNVGIGTTSPSTILNIQSSAPILRCDTSGVATLSVGFNNSGGSISNIATGTSAVWMQQAYPLTFGTNGSERMRIDSSGNVGIGTTSPTNYGAGYPNLTINGTTTGVLDIQANGTNQLELSTGTNYAQISAVGASGVLAFTTAGNTERMRIDSTGNVGIGTSSPTGKLDVRVTGDGSRTANLFNTTQAIGFRIRTSGTDNFIESVNTAETEYANFRIIADPLSLESSTFTKFITNNSERMRIDSSGNVGIGESSPDTKVHIYGASTAGRGQLYIQGSSTVSRFTLANSSDAYALNTYGDSSTSLLTWDTNSGYSFRWTTSDTERMRITSGGEVYIAGTTDRGAFNLQCNGTGVWGAGAYTNGSDARIKDDIQPIASSLEVVNKLNPVTFKYKEDWSKDQSVQTGFIAQELQETLKDEIYINGLVNTGGEYLSVAYQNIIPLLTKAIQEQNQIINDLKARVETLETK
jgi:hypothetical protein